MRINYAMVFVSDMKRSVAFYRDVLACVQEPTSMFGARIAQYVDPDGLGISVGEGS